MSAPWTLIPPPEPCNHPDGHDPISLHTSEQHAPVSAFCAHCRHPWTIRHLDPWETAHEQHRRDTCIVCPPGTCETTDWCETCVRAGRLVVDWPCTLLLLTLGLTDEQYEAELDRRADLAVTDALTLLDRTDTR